MKIIKIFLVPVLFIVSVGCSALQKLNQPISDTGYNPLDTPGMYKAGGPNSLVRSNNHGFNTGDIVEIVIPNTALFAKMPKPGDRYSKILQVGDTLRVIGGEKDFIKIVTEKGDVGYVSSVMVVNQASLNDAGAVAPSSVTAEANGVPIIPDVAPDPSVNEVNIPDPAPIIDPTSVPGIDAPLKEDPSPAVPDPSPVVPSQPNTPSDKPIVPGLPE